MRTANVNATCFLDVGAVLGVAGLGAVAHHVDGRDSEDVLVPHDEVWRDAVGSPVLIVDREPLLQE